MNSIHYKTHWSSGGERDNLCFDGQNVVPVTKVYAQEKYFPSFHWKDLKRVFKI